MMKLLILILVCGIMNAELTCVITDITGDVRVSKPRVIKWIKAAIGMKLEQGYKIKTADRSRVGILFEDGSKIIIGEKTIVNLSELMEGKTKLRLERGTIRNKVRPLKTGEVYNVETKNATVSIRGTDFVVKFEKERTDVYVMDGEVEFKNLITGESIMVSENETCTMIRGSLLEKKGMILPPEMDDILFPEEMPPEKERMRLKLKKELREFVRDVKTDGRVVREFLQEIKDADFSAGRTLIDRHGNLVRVEQLVLRPDPYTLQFLNLTKRDSYRYDGHFKGTEIPSTRRLDAIDFRWKFNIPLPTDFLEFPFWAYKHRDELFVRDMDFIFSCQSKFGTDIMGWEGEERYRREDDLIVNFIVGNGIQRFKFDGDYFKNREIVNGDAGGGEDGKIWMWFEFPVPMKPEGGGDTKVFWFQHEFYLINNKGEVLTSKYFLESRHKDPFTMLKEIAFQNICFVKEARLEKTELPATPDEKVKETWTKTDIDFFKNKNIDIVSTPDILISIGKKIAERISDIVRAVETGIR